MMLVLEECDILELLLTDYFWDLANYLATLFASLHRGCLSRRLVLHSNHIIATGVQVVVQMREAILLFDLTEKYHNYPSCLSAKQTCYRLYLSLLRFALFVSIPGSMVQDYYCLKVSHQ